MSLNPDSTGFGCFKLADLKLAVPMSHLKEVIPHHGLHSLPCPAKFVVGGIKLRGLSLPVIDLRVLVGQEASTQAGCVIVVQHNNRLLGLAADELIGLHFIAHQNTFEMQTNGQLGGFLQGCALLEEDQTMLSVLNIESLMALDGMPSVKQAACVVSSEGVSNPGSQGAKQKVSLMLFRCGKLHFGINPTGIEGTVANPDIESVGLAGGFFRGLIEHRGLKIPAVSLAALAGFDDKHAQYAQAMIIRTREGPAAYLVDEIEEIIQTDQADFVAIAGKNFSSSRIFTHALPNERIGQATRNRLNLTKGQHLVIDAQALAELMEVYSLVKTYVGSQEKALTEHKKVAEKGTRLLTFMLDKEYGTPLDQIVEVLSYSSEYALYDEGAELMGLVTNRGQSIPLYNLALRLGCQSAMPSANACILVVETQGGLVGFLVNKLITIDHAQWEPKVPLLGQASTNFGSPNQETQPVAEMNVDGQTRMITLIDLKDCAHYLTQLAPAS